MPPAAPCPNCGEQCSRVGALLYCPDCRRFVGRAGPVTSAGGTADLVRGLGGMDLSPSSEVIEANRSLDTAHAFEQTEHFREAARLYAQLGLEDEVERMEEAMAAHPSGGRDLPED